MQTCDRCGESCIVRYNNGLRAICPDCYLEVYGEGKTSRKMEVVA